MILLPILAPLALSVVCVYVCVCVRARERVHAWVIGTSLYMYYRQKSSAQKVSMAAITQVADSLIRSNETLTVKKLACTSLLSKIASIAELNVDPDIKTAA